MKEDEHEESVLKQSGAAKEPRLAQEDRENAVVHGIPREAIEAANDEEPRRIERCQGAAAGGQEVPHAEKEDGSAEQGEATSQQGGGRKTGNGKLLRSSENAQRDVPRHGAGYEDQEEERPQREKGLHGCARRAGCPMLLQTTELEEPSVAPLRAGSYHIMTA